MNCMDKKRHPALILLNIALEGHPVKIGNEEWTYADGVFGIVRKVFDGQGEEIETCVIGVDISMQAWIKMCEKASEAEVIGAVFSHVVTTNNRKDRP